jgi:hypothetical protein
MELKYRQLETQLLDNTSSNATETGESDVKSLVQGYQV